MFTKTKPFGLHDDSEFVFDFCVSLVLSFGLHDDSEIVFDSCVSFVLSFGSRLSQLIEWIRSAACNQSYESA